MRGIRLPGRVGIATWHLTEREPVLRGAEQQVHSASTIKVLIMIAALRAVRDGKLDPDEMVQLPRERTGGTGILPELPSVSRMSLRDLINLMIVISDNAATNAVLDQVGFEPVADCAADLGCRSTRVERHIGDVDAPGELRTTALDQARAMSALAEGEALPPELTAHALDVLVRQQVIDRLPALLPERARFWNKTGEIKGLRHDVALLGRVRPEVVVAVLVDGLTDPISTKGYRGGPGVEAISAIGRASWRALTSGEVGDE